MRGKLSFESKTFFRIIISYFILAILWSIACYQFDMYYDENRFHLKALGFVTLFSLSFIIGLKVRDPAKILLLLVVFISTFYVVSYVVSSLLVPLTDNLILAGVVMSSVSATVLVLALNSVKRIEFIYVCIIFTVLCALPAYLVPKNLEDLLYLDYNIHPSIVMFNVWQGLTVVSLSLGLSVKKQQPASAIQNKG